MKKFKQFTSFLLTAAITLSLCAVVPCTNFDTIDNEMNYEVMPIDSDYPDAEWI